MKYLDVILGKEVIVYPWSKNLKKRIQNNPGRYHQMFEE
jgi:hypothetical protein